MRLRVTAATAEELVAEMHQNYADFLQVPEIGNLIRQGVAAGGLDTSSSTALSSAIAAGVVTNRLTVQRWRRSRIVYRVDGELVAALAETDLVSHGIT